MKEELFVNVRGQWFIRKKFREWLKNNGIHFERNQKGVFLICHNQQQEEMLFNTFVIPESIIVAEKRFSRNQVFAHYTEKVDPELIFRGGILANKTGIMGEGIYAIQEEDFMNNSPASQNIMNTFYQRQLKAHGMYLGSSIILFNYIGPYLICKHGKGKEQIVKLIAEHVTEEQISTILEENIEYVAS